MATFLRPFGIATTLNGLMVLVSDVGNQLVRKLLTQPLTPFPPSPPTLPSLPPLSPVLPPSPIPPAYPPVPPRAAPVAPPASIADVMEVLQEQSTLLQEMMRQIAALKNELAILNQGQALAAH